MKKCNPKFDELVKSRFCSLNEPFRRSEFMKLFALQATNAESRLCLVRNERLWDQRGTAALSLGVFSRRLS
jgi:hypothetical protein